MTAEIHDLVVAPQVRPLHGSVPAPADDGMGQLALVVAALAGGKSELRRLARGTDVTSTIAALRALGVTIEDGDGAIVHVGGVSLRGLAAPREAIDCGDSLGAMHRLAGVLVGQPFRTVLTASADLMTSNVAGTASALRLRGAQIEGTFSTVAAGEVTPPLVIEPLSSGQLLSEVQFELPAAHAEIKEALLLSGMFADGPTYVRERIVSRDHLERMLQALDVPLRAAGPIVELDPSGWPSVLPAFADDIPGDVSAAILFVAMASLVPESRVCVREAGLNPASAGAFDLLRQMGGAVELEVRAHRLGSPEGVACGSYAPLRAIAMGDELLVRAENDVPVLVALAARAHGESEIALTGAAERSHAVAYAEVLRAFGVEAQAVGSGMIIAGRPEGALDAADVDSRGDPRVATVAIMLGLVAAGPTRIRDVDALAARFPRIVGTLRALGADVRVESRKA